LVAKNGAKHVESAVVSTAGNPILGYTAFCSVPTMVVPFEDIHQALADEGFDGSAIVPEVRATNTASRAFRRAKTALKQRGSDESERPEYRVKYIRSADGDRVYSLLRINVDRYVDRADGTQETLITVHQDGHVSTTAPAAQADALIAVFNDCIGKATDDDIRNAFVKFCIVDCLGFALRPTGGFYYIQPDKLDDVERFARAMQPWMQVYLCTMANDERGLTAMGASAEGALLSDVAAFEKECDLFAGREVRESTLQDRLAEFGDLSARAEFYKMAFSCRLSTFDDKIAALQKRVQDMLTGVESSAGERAAKSDEIRRFNQEKHVETLRIARAALRMSAKDADAFIVAKCNEYAKDHNLDVNALAEIVRRRMGAMASRASVEQEFDANLFFEIVGELKGIADDAARKARMDELCLGNAKLTELVGKALAA